MNSLKNTFLRDERGVAMTEFVIMLPVFVTLFVGIVNLSKLEVASARVKYIAATTMWDNAMAIDDDERPVVVDTDHGLPFIAAPQAMNQISGNSSPQGDPAAQWKNAELMTWGSQGEAEGAGVIANGSSNSWELGSDFSEDMTDDSMLNMLSATGSSALMVFNVSVPYSVGNTRHAGAIGTRYGLVTGENSKSITAGYFNANFNANYDVLVSPVSVPGSAFHELVTVGFSRLAAEDSPCLKSVLKISNDMDYDC